MYFKYQIFMNNSPQMAALSNTLSKTLAADFSGCLACPPVPGLLNLMAPCALLSGGRAASLVLFSVFVLFL